MKVVLVGFMGSGKTSVGRELARLESLDFVDTDSLVEAEAGMKIARIFEVHGEAFFRRLEARVIERTADLGRVVIATGGGAVLDPRNWRALTRGGVTVALLASPREILRRTDRDRSRPLLSGPEREKTVRELLGRRLEHYRRADFLVDTEGRTPRALALEISGLVRAARKGQPAAGKAADEGRCDE